MTGSVQALVALLRAPVNLAPMIASAFRGTPGTISAQMRFTSSGHAQVDNGSGFVTQYEWLFSGGTPGNYEINYSGSIFASGSAVNTWLALSADRTWTVTQVGLGQIIDTGTISIRQAAASDPVANRSVSLTASVGSP